MPPSTRFPLVDTVQGEYRADVTRDTFSPLDAFRRVIAQQGRPVLDADLNEQTSILLHYLECLAQDLGGPHFGRGDGFAISVAPRTDKPGLDLTIQSGRYWVEGLLCEANQPYRYFEQPDFVDPTELNPSPDLRGRFLVYLDAWEQHLTYRERPCIREAALAPADTASRSRVVWQVRYLELGANDNEAELQRLLADAGRLRPGKARLRAGTKTPAAQQESPCVTSPASKYRGVENQLYRVEVHAVENDERVLFKWSRDNSSVVFGVSGVRDKVLTLTEWARDDRFALEPLDWVELFDDEQALYELPREPVRVESVDRDKLEVRLKTGVSIDSARLATGHIFLRRWDHRTATPTVPATFATNAAEAWVELEDGIQVQFSHPSDADLPVTCQPGDYWLIPARVATGDVEWPYDPNNPNERAQQLPHGARHHYAPLALLTRNANGAWEATQLRNLLGTRR